MSKTTSKEELKATAVLLRDAYRAGVKGSETAFKLWLKSLTQVEIESLADVLKVR